MRKINVVLFSSGTSAEKGALRRVSEELEARGCNCFSWRDLFRNAKNLHVALLPMLIKKIPTFDFAVLLGEGHDTVTMLRKGEKISVPVMRDNVLFETGLCAMALGMSRVILLADPGVRLPEDLEGIQGFGVYRVTISEWEPGEVFEKGLQEAVENMVGYMNENRELTSPVVIGASASAAEGYATNFVMRVLEHLEEGFRDKETGEIFRFSGKQVWMHIVIPEEYTDDIFRHAVEERKRLRTGFVDTARYRAAEFQYRIVGDELHIWDYPTTLTTSYNTARMILDLDADDFCDDRARERFTGKELELFRTTLKRLLCREYVEDRVAFFYPHNEEDFRKRMADMLSDIFQYRLEIVTYEGKK